MTQVLREGSKVTDAKHPEGLSTVSKSASPYSEARRNEEALGPVPTLEIFSHDEPSNTSFARHTLLQLDNQKETKPTTSELYPDIRGGEKVRQVPWRVPHTAECQKRIWYHLSLGMGTEHVDGWGFSSTSVSRSQSPNNAAEPQDAENARGAKE